MTFGNFILRLRARLQDRRTQAGATITTINDVGVRWSADELYEIANQAIIDCIRTVKANPTSELAKRLVESTIEATGSVTLASGSVAMPSNVMAITQLMATATREFVYKKPDEFASLLLDASEPANSGYYYTVVYNIATTARLIKVKPATFSGAVSYTGIYGKVDYGTGNANDGIFLTNLDDLLLDIAEREARDREHNWDRSKILDFRIAYKLGVPYPQPKPAGSVMM